MPKPRAKTGTNGGRKRAAQQMIPLATLQTLLEGRANLARRAGIQFGGIRDVYAVAGYVPEGQLTFQHYWSAYKRDGVASRIVDMPAKTTWRTPPDVTEEDKPDGTPFTKAFKALAKRIRLWRFCERVDRLAGVGRYAVLFLGVRNTEDLALRTPLTKVSGPDDLLFVSVYNEQNAQVNDWVTDVKDPRFGQPLLYRIRVSSGMSGFPTGQLLVHASRVIHVAEDLLDDEVYGRPRLERCFNRLFDLDKVAASTGEAYWQMVARILQAEIDPTATITSEQLGRLKEDMAEIIHDLRRQFFGQGVRLSWLPADTPNAREVADFYFSLIAAASGIPKRILFGSELGQLASTTDQQTYLGTINERQEQFAEPQILRATLDRLLQIGALPAPSGDEYQIVWPSLFEEPDIQKADANLKRAQAAASLTPMGGDPLTIVEIDEDRNVWLTPKKPGEPSPSAPQPPPAPGGDLTAQLPPEAGGTAGPGGGNGGKGGKGAKGGAGGGVGAQQIAADEPPPGAMSGEEFVRLLQEALAGEQDLADQELADPDDGDEPWAEDYNPDQPRAPAGSPEGGEWSGGGGGGGGGAPAATAPGGPVVPPSDATVVPRGMTAAEAANFRAVGATKPTLYAGDNDLTRGVRAETERAIGAGEETINDNSPERQALREQEAEKLLTAQAAAQAREAWIVLGQGGGGKTTKVVNPILATHSAHLIDADLIKEDLSGGHPWKSAIVHEESSMVAKGAMATAIARGDNFVYSQIGLDATAETKMFDNLQAAGYDIHLTVNAVPPEVGAARAYTRFLETGRWSDPARMAGHDHKPEQVYEAVKSHPAVVEWTHFNNNVPHVTDPAIVVEHGTRPSRRQRAAHSAPAAMPAQPTVALFLESGGHIPTWRSAVRVTDDEAVVWEEYGVRAAVEAAGWLWSHGGPQDPAGAAPA